MPVLIILLLPVVGFGINTTLHPKDIEYSFTVTMENPSTHYFHVEMSCTGQSDEKVDFKMPVWTPGYYKIQNLSKYVSNFDARNEKGNQLPFAKTAKNCWRVTTKDEKRVIISYDVYAPELAVFESYLGADQAFISPVGVFMFPDGKIDQPVLVHLKPFRSWKNISTGLDKVDDQPNTYFASNFDVLFDCPILIGNHQVINFLVKGIPHSLAVSASDTLDKSTFIADLTKMVETATSMMGEIPYTHYTFLTIGSFGGGLEHGNSCALSCSGAVADTLNKAEYKKWLSFVTHEYFHLYNVKSIRPIALGPFDYERECYTNMLWVSEGFTVYYEYLILNRAGILTSGECLKNFAENIAAYENCPGHWLESATSSSFDAWIHFFDRSGDSWNNTISYYDKGCALGILLDMKIRNVTQSQRSLDDVMRGLYHTYYKELKRGFTDEEFKQQCEKVAGTSLDEIFHYAASVDPIDYPSYFQLAGLSIDTIATVSDDGVYFGASLRDDGENSILYNVERNSPVWNAGVGNGDELLTVEGQKADNKTFKSLLKTKKPGEKLHLTLKRGGARWSVDVVLLPPIKKSFEITPMKNASLKQKSVLESWLK